MSDDESIHDVATEIVLWQCTAQQLPLHEVREMASISLDTLAQVLNDFNKTYADDGLADDVLADAVAKVARQAAAAAIFTLGASLRTQVTAQRN